MDKPKIIIISNPFSEYLEHIKKIYEEVGFDVEEINPHDFYCPRYTVTREELAEMYPYPDLDIVAELKKSMDERDTIKKITPMPKTNKPWFRQGEKKW